MNNPLVNNTPVAGDVFAFDATGEFSGESSSSSVFSGKTIQPVCSDQIPSLKDLAIHNLACALSKEPEKILPARFCSELNKEDIHNWLDAGDESDRCLIENISKTDYLAIKNAYKIQSGKKAEELACTLKKWEYHATQNDRGSGFNSIGFIGAGTGTPWMISRQLIRTDEQTVSFPLCLSDIDDSIKHEDYYRACNFVKEDPLHYSPTFSSSSYSTGSFYSAKSSFSEEGEEEEKTVTYPLKTIPPELKCVQKEQIYLHKIGQYNAIDLVDPRYDGIMSFAVLGDKKKPLAVVIQLAFRQETPECFSVDNYCLPLLENPETMASYVISQCKKSRLPSFSDEEIKVVFEWIVNDSCREELFQKCIGPCRPSKFGILPLPEEDETTDSEPEGVPIPHPR